MGLADRVEVCGALAAAEPGLRVCSENGDERDDFPLDEGSASGLRLDESLADQPGDGGPDCVP